MRQLIKNESNEFDETDIREECGEFLANLPDQWGSDVDQKVNGFLHDVIRLRNTNFTPASVELGTLQFHLPSPVGVLSTKPISRGRGRVVKVTPTITEPVHTNPANHVTNGVGQHRIDDLVAELSSVQISYKENSDTHSTASKPDTQSTASKSDISETMSQAMFSYCPSIPETHIFKPSTTPSYEYEVTSEYTSDDNPNQYHMTPTKGEANLIRAQKSRTIDIGRLYKQHNCLEAHLVTKIDDKFKNPMGLGVTRDLVIIANSCENSVIAYDHSGNFKQYLQSEIPFKMPTVVLAIESGMVYVKDDTQVHVFDQSLRFIKVFGAEIIKRMPVGLMCVEGMHLVN